MEATTRLIDLTVDDLEQIIAREISKRIEALKPKERESNPEPSRPLYGIDGIAEALHCSRATALRRKMAGDLDGGFQQYGQKIIIRNPQVLRDLAERADQRRKTKTRTKKIITI